MASVTIPDVVSITASTCTLSLNGKSVSGGIGDIIFGKWHISGLISTDKTVVLEQDFARWGLFVYTSQITKPVSLYSGFPVMEKSYSQNLSGTTN